MTQQSLAEAAVEVMKRVEDENRAKSSVEVKLDGSNKVEFPGFPFTFRALNEKILISIDIHKTGYECKECKGTGKIETGKKRIAGELVIGKSIKWETVMTECSACEGRGGLLVLPETAKNLPTTGIIVSMGRKAKEELAKEDVHIGDRVLFGMYAGSMIPTKAGLMFKYMDWYLGVVKIEGASDMSAFDFILQAED